ncbi:class I SAM-dependent methyltransferase [Adlercreutzia sp. R21]|uniref:Class I SAM-dependent methyltransferase n=1 Tax=Adlercreutzia wanghongyangiae TaxID=3111451 RepID=A0ABU6IIP4_9ACTN|nr:class I SAM-dependent methyltransferase [Adlercreutzia sp. R21]MEC4176226.1 class I SAM-dependent methyltransferase [Adlercreutzia sp. R7]MEC4184310.1 class I SAM-dependent methyltransferase [Adlercreutzia sp. R21]
MSAADQPNSSSAAAGHRAAPLVGAYPASVIRKLNALTSNFYAREAASFSATRQTPWHGWEKAWEIIGERHPWPADQPLNILDLGCGNLRFERFLAERTDIPVHVAAIDNCPALVAPEGGLPGRIAVEFQTFDLVESLLGGVFADRLPHHSHDLAVAFGLMHHLPTFNLRARTLQGLASALRPGGFAVVSFWQFLNDPRLAAKATATTAEGRAAHRLPSLEPNDYLLGWQHAQGVYRFCHHADDHEIDALLAAAQQELDQSPFPGPTFHELARFSADGKQGNLNRYVVLQRI